MDDMQKTVMEFIAEIMDDLGIPYEYMEWTADKTYPYWTGMYIENESDTDGKEPYIVTLEGFNRGGMLPLEYVKEKIRAVTKRGLHGKDDETLIEVFYKNCLANMPTGIEELKKMQVNLDVRIYRK